MEFIIIFAIACFIVVFFVKRQEKKEAAQKNAKLLSNAEQELENKIANIEELRICINELNEEKKQLEEKINNFEKTANQIDYELYHHRYSFDKSEDYKIKLNEIIDKQKVISKNGALCLDANDVLDYENKMKSNKYYAAFYLSNDGDKKNQKKLQRLFKAALNICFKSFVINSENIIEKIKHDNIYQMIEKLKQSFSDMQEIARNFNADLNYDFLDLKIEELQLRYEYQVKLYKEKEEYKRIAEMIREEEKAKKEYEKVKQDAERKENSIEKDLQIAKKDFENASINDQQKLIHKIEQLELELKQTQEAKQRAISMAQQTKAGYVYIISNIGSFGENVYKIGMTRRLDPMDRVRELGDASVPFSFDVHAMVYSENAPELERHLHNTFDKNKVNAVNFRKEFFNVSLFEVEAALKQRGVKSNILFSAEAEEYRATLASA